MKSFFCTTYLSVIFYIVLISTLCCNVQICAATEEFKILYNVKEESALMKFRTLVTDVLETEQSQTDEFLTRWIRDANFDLEKANQKLRKSMEWRRINKISALDVNEQNQTYPIYLAGYDKTGSPIYYFPGNVLLLRKLVIAGKRASANRHMHAWFELGLKHTDYLRKQGQNVTQWIVVIDIAGFNPVQHACLGCLPFYLDFVRDYENNYPESAKNLVAINVPRLFLPIIDLAKPLMSPATRKGLRRFDSNKAELQEWFLSIAEPSKLLKKFGGTQESFPNFRE